MEENSEAHMETDVSSTTEDVLEVQQVTNSYGNVKMITVVVEEIKEEDIDEKNGKHQPCDDSGQTKSNEKSSEKVASTDVSESLTEKEPQQSIQISRKPAELQELNNGYVDDDPVNQPVLINVVDSSSKTETTKQPDYNKSSSERVDKINENDQMSIVTETVSKEKEQNFVTETNNTNEKQAKELTIEDDKTDKSNNTVIPVDTTIEKQTTVDTESNTDNIEKEQNKSISRELKSLINSAKESKIISECTQLTTKMRKPRTVLDSSNVSLNSSVEAEKIQGARRNSNVSQKSNCSEKSDKNVLKRSMRSQNPEFVSKVKQFLNSVTGKSSKDEDITVDNLDESKNQAKESVVPVSSSTPKKRKIEESNIGNDVKKLHSDPYCWRCHWAVEQSSEKAHTPMLCTVCPRSFHFKCLSGTERSKINTETSWVCPDCMMILLAESSETRSPAMKKISLGMLCDLLKFALERMMEVNGVEPFMNSVDREAFPDYERYVVHPMDLSMMKSNIAEGLYGSTEAFAADAQWILHNSIIFNTLQSKLTSGARALVRLCRAEMGEIEACPECYAAAHARRPTWFTDVCSTPHIVLWAKLKGFPYWPAKGMTISPAGLVDVRFFGAHDRAWVPAKDCFLYSEKDPNNFRTKRQDILDSMQEAEQHIRNISKKYGKFVYPPFKTQFDPMKLNEQLKIMIPTFEGEVRSAGKQLNLSPNFGKSKSRSNSKSSKSSEVGNDGDTSEAEDPLRLSSSNGVDNINVSKEDNSLAKDKDNYINMEVLNIEDIKEGTTRKRRRSELEEAVITILDSGTTEKRKRVEDQEPEEIMDFHEPTSSKDIQKESEAVYEKSNDTQKNVKTILEEILIENDKPPNSYAVKEKIVQCKDNTEKPIKITIQTKLNKHVMKTQTKNSPKSSSTPNDKMQNMEKPTTPQRQKTKRAKSLSDRNREEISKSERRHSKVSRSLSNNSGKSEQSDETPNDKDKPTEKPSKCKTTETGKSGNDKNTSSHTDNSMNNSKTDKDRLKTDYNTSLTAIVQESIQNVEPNNVSGLPTISSVVSLSTLQKPDAIEPNTSTEPKTVEITIEGNPDSSIFTPTSTENIVNVKDAANKLQKLRNDNEPRVGRVGVRAFARMTSPEKQINDNMQVEIKAEPIDLDEPERHMEKMDLMNAFKLQPVNPASSLREVRINKVVVTPLNRKAPTKAPEIRPKAKKTFPQAKKPEDSQLNGKNSMVYIPIQPPMTQAPVRFSRPVNANGPVVNTTVPRASAPSTTANNIVNTVTPPLVPIITSMSGAPPSTTPAMTMSAAVQSLPTIAPTTVHTVPFMTSVNGQWMFSLQPIMSVGGIDSSPSAPTINGLPDRASTVLQPITSATSNTANDVAASGDPPRLQQRPALMNPLDPNTPSATVPPPSSVGPLTARINQNAVKLTDFFRTLLEDSLDKLDDPTSQTASLKLQLEQFKWKHQQQLDEIKHNHKLVVTEMRSSFEKEKMRVVNEVKKIAQNELEAAIKLTKSKQWCANCSQEAQFYCCWNTSYCDYPCQRAHWSQHFSSCTQQRTQDGSVISNDGSSPPESRLQPQPEGLPALQKKSSAPALTVGGKLAPRLAPKAPQNNSSKTSIIINMSEDNIGNKTVKCVGTYSGGAQVGAPTQVPPLILNKQLLNDEANKKVVTSGGYLIVGAGTSNTSVVSQSRRSNAIQYYT